MSLLLSVSGLRGIVGPDITPDVIMSFARAFGAYMKAQTAVIGRDTRRSGPTILNAVIQGLKSTGCHVIDLGIVPTPTVVFMVKESGADCGIVVTASHNPVEYNGLKFIARRGEFLNERELASFLRFMKKSTGAGKAYPPGKIRSVNRGGEKHIAAILRRIKPAKRKLKVGVDAVGGAGAKCLPELLRRLRCQVFCLNCSYRRTFPRPAEPVPKNLTGIRALVRRKNLDLGFAVDPDCDRLAIIDETGRPIGEENTLALVTDHVLRGKKGSVVTNLSTTSLIDQVARKHRCRLYRTKVGEANVITQMKKVKAIVGGEGNGGVIYPAINMTRDALVAAAIIISYLSRQNEKLSRIMAAYPRYHMFKDKIAISKEDFHKKESRITRQFKGRISRIDGLKITAPTYWLHIRPSNTEPLIRVIAESRDREWLKDCMLRIRQILSPKGIKRNLHRT